VRNTSPVSSRHLGRSSCSGILYLLLFPWSSLLPLNSFPRPVLSIGSNSNITGAKTTVLTPFCALQATERFFLSESCSQPWKEFLWHLPSDSFSEMSSLVVPGLQQFGGESDVVDAAHRRARAVHCPELMLPLWTACGLCIGRTGTTCGGCACERRDCVSASMSLPPLPPRNLTDRSRIEACERYPRLEH
jgi:hypothetical protein